MRLFSDFLNVSLLTCICSELQRMSATSGKYREMTWWSWGNLVRDRLEWSMKESYIMILQMRTLQWR